MANPALGSQTPRRVSTRPNNNPFTPPIPAPTTDVNNLRACVEALKASTESLTGQRGDAANRAVTFRDLIGFGVLSPGAVQSPGGSFGPGGGGDGNGGAFLPLAGGTLSGALHINYTGSPALDVTGPVAFHSTLNTTGAVNFGSSLTNAGPATFNYGPSQSQPGLLMKGGFQLLTTTDQSWNGGGVPAMLVSTECATMAGSEHYMLANLPPNQIAFPVALTGYAKLVNGSDGNVAFGCYGLGENYSAGGGGVAGMEITVRNFAKPTDPNIPPDNAFGTKQAICNSLQLTAGGDYDSTIGCLIGPEGGSSVSFLTALWIPGFRTNGIYIADQTSGAQRNIYSLSNGAGPNLTLKTTAATMSPTIPALVVRNSSDVALTTITQDGMITVPANPVSNLHVATKQYVDASVRSPGNPTATASNVAVNGTSAAYMRADAAPAVQLASSTLFGLAKVDGVTITAAGGVITATAGSGSYLSLSGGTMTGPIRGVTQLGIGTVTAGTALHIKSPDNTLSTDIIRLSFDGTNYVNGIGSSWNAGTAAQCLMQFHVSDGTTTGRVGVMTLTGGGLVGVNAAAPVVMLDVGNATSTRISSAPNPVLYAGYGGIATYGGVVLGAGVNGNTPFVAASKDGNGVALPLTFSTNAIERMRIDTNGNVGIGTTAPIVALDVGTSTTTHLGTLQNMVLYAGYGGSFGGVFLGAGVNGNAPTVAASQDGSGGALPLLFYTNGAERFRVDTATSSIMLKASAGDDTNAGVIGYRKFGAELDIVGAGTSGNRLVKLWDNITVAGTASKPGGGSWADSSDIRVKQNIEDYTTGLEAVLALRPVSFEFNGKASTPTDGRRYIGLVANEAQLVMPEMVGVTQHEEMSDILTLDSTALPYALINAMREIEARLKSLEERHVST